jgi:hypothetical protein
MMRSGGPTPIDEVVRLERQRWQRGREFVPVAWGATSLLVPEEYARARAAAKPDETHFIGLRLSWKDIFGDQPTWDDISRCLRRYPLAQVLDVPQHSFDRLSP